MVFLVVEDVFVLHGWLLLGARQWEELPLTESVNLSVSVFGKSFLTGEPQRLMQGFLDRKK